MTYSVFGGMLNLTVTLLNLHYCLHSQIMLHPLPSNRQHLSYDVCLVVRREIIRTVLCCIVY